MVTPELIERVKQVNISKDKEKTMERVKNAFSSASRKQKQEIESLSGQKRTAIYRVFKTGSLNAKVLLPLSEVLNITPFWFTGESDEMDPCTDALILSFLDGRGYKFSPKQAAKGKRAAAAPEEGKPARAPRKSLAEPVASDDETVTVTITLSNTPQMRAAVERLDADNAAQLLQALCLRAKAGGNAEQLWDVVKLCLLS
ncbi:MAG: hypothetical protein LBH95_05450 [Oscillospiraceae bacterium]|jgi:hypothetical protein|nr:hypothetical protein [Oscillospiraceae bacterium]